MSVNGRCDVASSAARRRRAWLASATGLAVATLAGCGFTLRGAAGLPFRRIALVGFTPHAPLLRALRAQLAPAVSVVDNPAMAEVVLQSLKDARERAVVASTAAGQVREIQLRVRLQWRASTPQGRELVAPSELLLARDMSYTETAALAKEKEAELIYAAMDEDIAAQVMRRLAMLQLG